MRVAVIGLGYVGVPLAVEFGRGGLDVVGLDVSQRKVDELNRGASYIVDIPDSAIKELVDKGHFRATTDFSVLSECDAACICVPTPLRKTSDPDLSFIIAAVEDIAKYLHKGMLIVLQSTTYPGTTEELLLPKFTELGFEAGRDFYLAFSPERVDPGNKQYNTRNTPKVIGGITPACTEKAVELYRHAVDTLIPVSSARVAEMVKLLENTYRAINIGMVNELAIMCDRLDVDVWEVIGAAKTKPFGFMPFYPGPGLGGHCIPIDPLYLSWKLKTINYTARFIELASSINAAMPEYVVQLVSDALNDKRKSVNGSKVLILGVAYKKDIDDVRESPAVDIIELLKRKGADVDFADPYVPLFEEAGEHMQAYDLSRGVQDFDCVVIVTDHTEFNCQEIVNQASLVVDTRNATAAVNVPSTCTVVKL